MSHPTKCTSDHTHTTAADAVFCDSGRIAALEAALAAAQARLAEVERERDDATESSIRLTLERDAAYEMLTNMLGPKLAGIVRENAQLRARCEAMREVLQMLWEYSGLADSHEEYPHLLEDVQSYVRAALAAQESK